MNHSTPALHTLASHLASFADLLRQLEQTPEDSATIIPLLEECSAIKNAGLMAGLVDFAGFGVVLEGVLSRVCLTELQCDAPLIYLLGQSEAFFLAIWQAESQGEQLDLAARHKADQLLSALVQFYLANHSSPNLANQLYDSEQSF